MIEQNVNTSWHFPIMVLVSLILFNLIIRIVIGQLEYREKVKSILVLSFFVVVIGMFLGKYGAQVGLEWWIFYPIPMLMTLFLPPYILKMNLKETSLYLFLSFISAPIIHAFFSFFLGWKEYMPFWEIPSIKELF